MLVLNLLHIVVWTPVVFKSEQSSSWQTKVVAYAIGKKKHTHTIDTYAEQWHACCCSQADRQQASRERDEKEREQQSSCNPFNSACAALSLARSLARSQIYASSALHIHIYTRTHRHTKPVFNSLACCWLAGSACRCDLFIANSALAPCATYFGYGSFWHNSY